MGGSGSYMDKMAIHFATEEVADCYYGAEKGNEIFIAYPSAYIASQYYFQGKLNAGDSGYWNDQWVWANEERGIDLNTGLVFIPEEARVDRETGSRYELDENKNPVIDKALQEGISFSEAKNKISSREFWETYFAKNPSKRPSKIIYYKSADPTSALQQWKKEHQIDKKAQTGNIGFSERNVGYNAPQATAGFDRFMTLAKKVIEDYFTSKNIAS